MAIVWVVLWVSAFAGDSPDAIEVAIRAELERANPMALEAWEAANTARDHDDYAAAIAGYTTVQTLAPLFDGAPRRMCGVQSDAGEIADAKVSCARALALGDTALNHAAQARLMLAANDIPSARQELDHLAELQAGDALILPVRAQVELSEDKVTDAVATLNAWAAAEPTAWQPHGLLAYVGSGTGDLATRDREIQRAVDLGMPSEQATLLRSLHNDADTDDADWVTQWALRGLAVWGGVWLALTAMGLGFSWYTSRTARRMLADPASNAHVNSGLRVAYRMVMVLLCAAYFLSLPVVAVLAFALGVGVFGLALALRRLWFAPLIAALNTVAAIARSAVARTEVSTDRVLLDLDENPAVRAFLNRVAEDVGTDPVDEVQLLADVTMAVTERVGVAGQMVGRSSRTLLLGVGFLDGLSVGAFRAILAHEYGHFAHGDTAGGGFALSARASLHRVALHLAQGGVASNLNPAWLFLRGFDALFVRVSAGASRLQELHADRVSACLYGAERFVDGLSHAVRVSVVFDDRARRVLDEAVHNRTPVPNLYTLEPAQQGSESERESKIAEQIGRNGGPWDSHPTPRERFAWVRAVGGIPPKPAPDDAAPAWTLFADREAVQRQMTGRVLTRVLEDTSIVITQE